MNTSRKMNTSRSKRKKAIPHYFRKNQSSLSDILQTASYKRRIKELLKNNKSLALTVQDAKYTIADQQKRIDEYASTSNRVSYAQLKLKDMASSIQKLVCDLQQVQEYLDVNNLKTNFDSIDRRIRIQAPDYSTIEESASRTTLEVDLTLAEDRSPSRSQEVSTDPADSLNKSQPTQSVVECVKSPGYRDDDMTEIYDHNATLMKVGPVAKGGFVKPQEDNNRKNQITDKDSSVSIPIRSHPKPQLETAKNKPPGRLEAFLQSYKEYPRIPLQALNSGSAVKNTSNAFTSKIPKVSKTQATQRETEISKPVEASIDIANHRRATFVVLKPCDHVPEVFATAEDRRGTFVISKPSEVSKFQNDRRETYVVPPVSPVHEKLIPESNLVDLVQDNNFDEPVPPAEKDIPNRTILLCEDMELTGVIPTGKVWTHEGVEMAQPCEEMKTVLPETSKDVECRDVISKMPIVNSPLKDTNVTKEHAVLERNVSSKKSTTSTKGLNGQDCFVKPCMSQNNPPMPVLSNIVSPEIVSSEDAKKSRKSAVKRKKSHDLEPPEKPKKGRASSTSKRKSVAPKAASDVSSKGAHRKSIQRASSRKSVIPKDPEVDFCSDLEDEIFSNISISSSPSPHRRETRDKKSINFEKYFMDASYEAVPPEAKKEVPLGRRVIDFFETRESLVPNKRNFVFTSKKTNTESTSTAQESASNSKAIELTKQEMDERVFEFTASDSEDGNRKTKKSKKRSKKVDLTSQSQKESKKPHLEEVSHPQTEKLPEIVAEHKNKTASKKSESVSTNLKKKSFASTSSETSDYKESKAIIQNSDTLKSENGSSEIRITSVTCSKSNETAKEHNNEKAFSDKESKSVEHSVKILVSNTETLTLPLGTDNNKLTHAKHEQVIDIKKGKDVEPPVSKEHISSKKDVLSDTVASSLLIEKHHKSSKELNSNKVTSVLEKQKDSANNLKVTQNVKSKNRRDHEEPSVPCSSTDKNNAVLQNTAAKFNRADFNAMNLDDLTSNDFVPVKTKKLFKESQNKMDVATLKEKQSKSKRPRMGKPNSKENKAAKVKVSVETDLNSTASKGEHNLEEVFNHANSTDAIPIHRQNCSGSIGSLCNADSKENEGRPSRRNRGTKSYKEPPLNVKMRR